MSDATTIGNKLVELCKQGKNVEAVEQLYADDVVSVEAATPPGAVLSREVKSKDAVLAKNKWWVGAHEVHGSEIVGPFPHGDDRFAVIHKYDVTVKESGQRYQMQEVAVYQVRGGKIAREEFYYSMG